MRDVRFTPNNGRWMVQVGSPKSAKSGHLQLKGWSSLWEKLLNARSGDAHAALSSDRIVGLLCARKQTFSNMVFVCAKCQQQT